MKERLYRRKFPGFFALLLVMIGVSSMSEAADLDQLADEVRNREIAFAKTMADRDLDAFKTFVSEEAIFFDKDPLRGKARVVEVWSAYYVDEAAPFSWQPDLVEVLDSGDLALSSGPVYNPAGEVVGRFNSIWRKEADGIWRVVFDKGS